MYVCMYVHVAQVEARLSEWVGIWWQSAESFAVISQPSVPLCSATDSLSRTDWLPLRVAWLTHVLMWKCSALSRGREVRVRLVSKQNETRPISFTFSNCHCYDLCYDECEFYVAFPDDVIHPCAICFASPAQELNFPTDADYNHYYYYEYAKSRTGTYGCISSPDDSDYSCCVLNIGVHKYVCLYIFSWT